MQWLTADALRPETYSHLLPGVSGVVHTLGTLLPDTRYKDALRRQDLAGAAASIIQSLTTAGGNPLEGHQNAYETLNRDAGASFVLLHIFIADVQSSCASGDGVREQYRKFTAPASLHLHLGRRHISADHTCRIH